MARCLIGCGSNLGSRREQLDRAIELLRFMPGVTIQAVSRYRETRPIGGPPGQPAYLNGACLIETDLEPLDVLGMLAAVEQTLERQRQERWSARTIDLDLLLYDELVLESRMLTVPHPRMATRRFVLEPCVEIAPDLAHPTAGCSLRDLLDAISAPCPLIAVVGVPGSGAPEVAAVVADATMARLIQSPRPVPFDNDDGDTWIEVARQQAAALPPAVGGHEVAAMASGDDCGAAVADFWLGTLAAAASLLPVESRGCFEGVLAPLMAATAVPHAVILLEVDAETLAERIAFQSRRAAAHTNVFADVAAGHRPRGEPDSLLGLQDTLQRWLCCREPRVDRVPNAVVTIDARDLAQAADEATAAVEAMLG
jgi:2-amino-4-hydroxy-6-hydroxymethyldihydropteridine diphosphokinase